MSTIKRRVFTPTVKEHVPCPTNIKMQQEKSKVLLDIFKTENLGLNPKILEAMKSSDYNKLAKVQTRLNDCLLCDGNCGCGK